LVKYTHITIDSINKLYYTSIVFYTQAHLRQNIMAHKGETYYGKFSRYQSKITSI